MTYLKKSSSISIIKRYFPDGIKNESEVKFNLNIVLLFIPAAYITYLFHELGHWIIGTILGNDMVYTINGVWPRNEYYLNINHGLLVYIGGPVFTIFQSVLILFTIAKFKIIYAYPFVFFPVFSRFFSLILGGFSKQDEAKISAMMGIGDYTVAFIVLFILLIILLRASHKLNVGLKYNCYFIAIGTACIMLVIWTSNVILK